MSLAKNIERARLPVVVFGLGSQAPLNGPFEFSVATETIRLLRVISDHSRKVAVRGAFTADACAKLGVKNVEVVGCQSIFWHRSPQFDWTLFDPIAAAPDKIAFNFSDAQAEAALINQAMSNGFDVIGQGDGAEEDLKSQNCEASRSTALKFSWDVMEAIKKSLIDRAQYESRVRNHFFQFRRPEAWIDHMRRYCFSYGTRLHGNMTAIIAGVRSLWIVHDMRTKELCDHFCLPWVELAEVRAGAGLQALFDRADYSECHKAYPDRYRTLFDYVEKAGLPHSLPAPVTAMAATGDGHR